MESWKDRLIVALDMSELHEAEKLLRQLEGAVSFYKIGMELFTAEGWKAVDLVKRFGARVFLDLKFHDIPHTVEKTLGVVCEHQIDMVNIHTLGGYEMMCRAAQAVHSRASVSSPTPILLGVTVLTSHTSVQLSEELGIGKSVVETVLDLARLAQRAGLDGVVSSPQEVGSLRKIFPRDFCVVTPGVRPSGAQQDDQKRVMTPQEALAAGSSYIVMGRPITGTPDPKARVHEILGSLKPSKKTF